MVKKAKVQTMPNPRITDFEPNPATIARGIENPIGITITVADLDPAHLNAAVMLVDLSGPDGNVAVKVTGFQANELITTAHANAQANPGDRRIAVFVSGTNGPYFTKPGVTIL